MKKIFTLIVALVGFAGLASASTVDDIQPLKHSYVFVADDYTNNGLGARTKGGLFGDDHFLDVTGGSVSTGKGGFDLSVVDDYGIVTADIAAKYGKTYAGSHLNSLRLKNAQDVIAFKATAGSKIIIFYQNNSKDRYPYFAKDAALANDYKTQGTKYIAYDKPGVDKAHSSLARIEWTVPADADGVTTYVGSKGGDMFLSYIIVEAKEDPGTPLFSVGAQQYENGRYFKTVTITPQEAEGAETVVQYTTDGSTPTATNGTLYKEPFKVYGNTTVKAVPFLGQVEEGLEVTSSDGVTPVENEQAVSFKFNAPTIEDDGNGNVTISSEYKGGENYASYLDQSDVQTSSFALTESSPVDAYTVINNGQYNGKDVEFESAHATADVYVLTALAGDETLDFAKAAVEEDPEKTTADAVAYKFSDITKVAPKDKFYFNGTPAVGIVNEDAYKVDNDSVYLKMSNAKNLTFKIAEGDSIDVTVVTSKNSCKNITDVETIKDGVYTSLQNFVNVDGTNYGFANTPDKFENVIKFGLKGGVHTFQKYSGTGNILVKSISFKKVATTGIKNINAAENVNGAQKPVKVIENGRLVIKSAKGTFAVDGSRLK